MAGRHSRKTDSASTRPTAACVHDGTVSAQIAQLCGSGTDVLWFDHAYATEGAARILALQHSASSVADGAAVPSKPITEITRDTLRLALQLQDKPGDEIVRFEAQGGDEGDAEDGKRPAPVLVALLKANEESPEQQRRAQALVELLTTRLRCLHAVVLGREGVEDRGWPHRLLIVGIDDRGELAGVESEIVWTG